MENEIDQELETSVFLLNAEEGNYGLYQFIWELGYYKTSTIGQKYEIASRIIYRLCKQNLITLNEYNDPDFLELIGNVNIHDLDPILNDPTSWYPHSKAIYVAEITPKGKNELDSYIQMNRDLFNQRVFQIEIHTT